MGSSLPRGPAKRPRVIFPDSLADGALGATTECEEDEDVQDDQLMSSQPALASATDLAAALGPPPGLVAAEGPLKGKWVTRMSEPLGVGRLIRGYLCPSPSSVSRKVKASLHPLVYALQTTWQQPWGPLKVRRSLDGPCPLVWVNPTNACTPFFLPRIDKGFSEPAQAPLGSTEDLEEGEGASGGTSVTPLTFQGGVGNQI